jgi:ubiquinone/menaquinone biosynthesis C-methylase UbiE
VEAVSFPLEDRCADLLQSGVVQKAPLDALPFDDSEFQLVTAFNVLEYIPTDKLDLVLDEMGRVAQSRMVVAVQLPDYESTRGLNPDSILQPESFFPRSWWQERLEAHGFHVSTVRMAMYALQFEHTKSTKKKLSDVDGLFLLTKVPANPFAAARATQAEVCVSCAYMPLVYSIYAPQSGRALPGSKMHMTHTAVVSPSACSLVRGMDLSPPKGLKKLKGVARNEYLVEMGCPDLQDQGKLTFSNPEREEELPFATASFDVVLSMHDLEYLPEKLVGAAMEELARVTTAHVLAVVNVCGNKYTTPHCPAAGLVGLQTLKSRAWWVEKFAKHGLSLHPVSGVFERRPCDAEGKAVHPTTVDDGWSIADVRSLCDCVPVSHCVSVSVRVRVCRQRYTLTSASPLRGARAVSDCVTDTGRRAPHTTGDQSEEPLASPQARQRSAAQDVRQVLRGSRSVCVTHDS